MKKIILPFITLSVIISLSTFDVRAQRIQMMETPDYVGKTGQNYVTTFKLTECSPAPVIPPPCVSILGDDFIDMRATKCSLVEAKENGYFYELHLEIGAAVDFGSAVNSHIRLSFDLGYDRYVTTDFWTEQSGLDVGCISPSSQNLLYGTTAQTLTYSSNDLSYFHSVEWQRKVGSGDWTNISHATLYSYSPGYMMQTTQFRMCVTSKGGDTGYTVPVIVNVSPRFVPGTIYGNQAIIPGYAPTTIMGTDSASGGSGTIIYQWQAKQENVAWTDIPGAMSATYQPPALTAVTFYRRKATSGTETAYSNMVTISIKPLIAEYLAFLPVADVVSENDRDNRTKGLKTYEKVGVLDGNAAAGVVERAFYYDYKGRIIQTVEKNCLGGISRYSTKYDFVGNVLKNHEQHVWDIESTTNDSDQKLTEFTYDHRGRLLTEATILNGGEPAMVSYTYDALGRLTGKIYGDQNKSAPEPGFISLAQIPVGTNIRGWIFKITRMELYADLPIEEIRSLSLNGKEWIIMNHYDGDNVNIDCNYAINATKEELSGMYDGGWYGDIGCVLSIKNDQDYIVTANDLPASHEAIWGFDYIVQSQGSDTGSTALTETYDYNIQGWQTAKSSPYFDMKLHYFDPQKSDSVSSYTGNITEWEWIHKDLANVLNIKNAYTFTYDKLSRLTGNKRFFGDSTSPVNTFTEQGISYDRNGNILTLRRYGAQGLEKDFHYNYNGNQLGDLENKKESGYVETSIFDYDANGNMTNDGLNNLELKYNYLNLIKNAKQNGAIVAKYVYLADGTKFSVTDNAGNGLYYLGSLVYDKQGGRLALESAGFSSGRFVVASNSVTPNYHITDHLGSVRVIVDNLGEVKERNDYHAFGLRWNTGQLSDNRYRYNGKEQQTFANIPYTDYGARMYNPITGRWFNVDPQAELYRTVSPYVYIANNPINAIDPDGNLIIFINGMHTGDGASGYPTPRDNSGKNWQGTREYWASSDNFDTKVKNHLNDQKAIYRDGRTRGCGPYTIANSRYKAGYNQGAFDAKKIIAGLGRNEQGTIVETIKIITHSMGAAYGKGYVTALISYIQEIGLNQSIIEFEADFAPYQPDQQEAVNNVPTFQYSHSRDGTAGNKKMQGAYIIDTSSDPKQTHRLHTFSLQIMSLPTGDYEIVNGKIVPKRNN